MSANVEPGVGDRRADASTPSDSGVDHELAAERGHADAGDRDLVLELLQAVPSAHRPDARAAIVSLVGQPARPSGSPVGVEQRQPDVARPARTGPAPASRVRARRDRSRRCWSSAEPAGPRRWRPPRRRTAAGSRGPLLVVRGEADRVPSPETARRPGRSTGSSGTSAAAGASARRSRCTPGSAAAVGAAVQKNSFWNVRRGRGRRTRIGSSSRGDGREGVSTCTALPGAEVDVLDGVAVDQLVGRPRQHDAPVAEYVARCRPWLAPCAPSARREVP